MISPVLPSYARAPLSFEKGQGAWLETADGTRYLDFGAGVAVNSLGHAHPALISTLEEQAHKLWHCSNLYQVPGQVALAEKLVSLTFADTVFFTNSGTESMECAVKMARKYHYACGNPQKNRIITFDGGFHGRTLGMISSIGSKKLTEGFAPLLPGFDHAKFGDIESVRQLITPETAAIAVEPVQGEGGIIPAPEGFLKELRHLCDVHEILLIFDEIQTGVGRTGKFFAHEWSGVTPDIMAVAKGIGGGFPLGACLATEEAAKGMTAGTHGSTFGGNPLAVAVGLKVTEIVSDPAFLENVRRSAGRLRQGLEGLVASHPDVFEVVRGEGLMLGLKCKVPNTDVVNAGYDQRLLMVLAGDNVARLLPPLNIDAGEIDEALARLERAAQALEARG